MANETTSGDAASLERLDPAETGGDMAAQHWVRYEWAAQFLPAQRVLDCACGVGYGSSLLATRGAREVLGVDISNEAIAEAHRRYPHERVKYIQASGLDLTEDAVDTFDLIVSLETVEHVDEPQRLLDLFRELLKPEGTLAISIPNDLYLGVENPYHAWRAEFAEVYGWLTQRFAHVHCFAEVRTLGTAVVPREWVERRTDGETPRAVPTRPVDTLPIESATGFLFACGDTAPTAVHPVSSQLFNGLGYVRSVEAARDRFVAELKEAADAWNESQGWIAKLEQRCSQADDEQHRLKKAWEDQRTLIAYQAERIAALEARQNRP